VGGNALHPSVFAHGESVGKSMAQAKAYYLTVLDVVAFVADLVDPPKAA
jgi:hypothetical protein